jgi:uncharacterized protein
VAIPARVSFITLGVDDLDRATRFYQALGWPLSSGSVPGDVSFFRTAGGLLALWGVKDLAADLGLPQTPNAGFRATAIAMNLDTPAQVDEALSTAAAAGGKVVVAGRKTVWGGYQGYFADPDGHIWEVVHNPSFPIGSDRRPTLP